MTAGASRYSSAGLNGFTASVRRGLTSADLAFISEHRAKGRSWQTIATMMGRSRSDIEAASSVEAHTQARAKAFDWTPEHLETAQAYYRAGNNPTALAIKVGCSIDEASEQLAHQREQAAERARLALNERRRAKHAALKPPKSKQVVAVKPSLGSEPPLPSSPISGSPSPLEVAAVAAAVCGLNLAAMCRTSREQHRVRGRWIAAWAIKKYCAEISYPEIGRVLGGLHHTTVLAGVRRLEELIGRGQYADVLKLLDQRLARPVSDGRVAEARAAYVRALSERAKTLRAAA